MRTAAVAWTLRLWANRSQPKHGRPTERELLAADEALRHWLGALGHTPQHCLAALVERFDRHPEILAGFAELDQRYLRALGDATVHDQLLGQPGRRTLQSLATDHVGGGTKYRERVADLNDRLALRLMPLLTAAASEEAGIDRLVLGLDGPTPSAVEFRERTAAGLELARWLGLGSVVTGGEPPAYHRRSVDGDLDRSLSRVRSTGVADPEERVIVVSGPPMAGKTRSVIEALARSEIDRWPIHVLVHPSFLPDYADRAGPGAVLVVDLVDPVNGLDQDRSTSAERPVRTADLHRVAEAGSVVIVTVGPGPAATDAALDGRIGPDRQLVGRHRSVVVDSRLDRWEAEAAGLSPGHRLGESFAGPTMLVARARAICRPQQADPLTQHMAAVILALCDAALFCHEGPSTEELASMAEPYWRARQPGQWLDPATIERAIRVLNRPIGASDSTWAIALRFGSGWVLHPALGPHLLPGHDTHADYSSDQALTAGVALLATTGTGEGTGGLESAIDWLRRADELGDPQAPILIDQLLDNGGLGLSGPTIRATLQVMDVIDRLDRTPGRPGLDRSALDGPPATLVVEGTGPAAADLFRQLELADRARSAIGLAPLSARPIELRAGRDVDRGRPEQPADAGTFTLRIDGRAETDHDRIIISTDTAPPDDLPTGGRASRTTLLFELMGRLCHEDYRRHLDRRNPDRRGTSVDVPWSELGETHRRANLAQAAGLLGALAGLDVTIGPISSSSKERLSDEEVSQLGRLEHERWCRERQLQGWVFGPRWNEAERTHPDLRPWSELSPEARQIDLDVARRLPGLLALAGLGLTTTGR